MDPLTLGLTIAGLVGALGGGAYAGYKGSQQQKGGATQTSLPGGGTRTTLGSSGSFLGGSPSEILQTNRFQPEQLKAIQELIGPGLQGVLSGLGGQQQQFNFKPIDFGPIEQSALRGFHQNIVPSIAERFASLGGSGTAGSSGLFGTLGSAGANLQSQLASQRAKYEFLGQNNQLAQAQFQNQNNAQRFQQAMQALQLGLTPQFESSYFPATQGAAQPLLQGAAQGFGSLGALYGAQKLGL